MQFDFTTVLDRRGKDALALDAIGENGMFPAPKDGFDVIPMWVADMNYPVVPSIQRSISDRLAHPTFGYFMPREDYYQAIIQWQNRHHSVEGLRPEHIGYENGVLGGVVTALNVICSRGDKVLLHSPTYIGFTFSLKDNGYDIVHSPLKQDEQGIWRMDLEDMERKLSQQKIHAAIFCSPHNPTGRVWEKREIEQAMELYKKYDVWVVSDEIWSDLVLPGYHHIPTQSVSEDAKMRTVALYAPSKTFNLAGLIGSYHIIYNPWLRDRCRKESDLGHYNKMNVLSMYALMGAYCEEGNQWLLQLRDVLDKNVDYACEFITNHFEGVSIARPQGTYMLFLNCEQWCKKTGKTMDELIRSGWDVGVYWQDGRPFHAPYHIRMNLALPLSRVQEAFKRLEEHVFHSCAK